MQRADLTYPRNCVLGLFWWFGKNESRKIGLEVAEAGAACAVQADGMFARRQSGPVEGVTRKYNVASLPWARDRSVH